MSGPDLAQHSRPERRDTQQTFVEASHEGRNQTCDRLLHHRIQPDGQVRYLVLWAPTWEHANDISNFEQVISNYQPKEVASPSDSDRHFNRAFRSANLRWQTMGTIQEKSPSYRDEVHVRYMVKPESCDAFSDASSPNHSSHRTKLGLIGTKMG